VSGQRHAPAALYPWGKTPGTRWIGGWVGLRAVLDTEARGKNPFPTPGIEPLSPVCSQKLYWLSWPSSHVTKSVGVAYIFKINIIWWIDPSELCKLRFNTSFSILRKKPLRRNGTKSEFPKDGRARKDHPPVLHGRNRKHPLPALLGRNRKLPLPVLLGRKRGHPAPLKKAMLRSWW
jgi:hypothetical protein